MNTGYEIWLALPPVAPAENSLLEPIGHKGTVWLATYPLRALEEMVVKASGGKALPNHLRVSEIEVMIANPDPDITAILTLFRTDESKDQWHRSVYPMELPVIDSPCLAVEKKTGFEGLGVVSDTKPSATLYRAPKGRWMDMTNLVLGVKDTAGGVKHIELLVRVTFNEPSMELLTQASIDRFLEPDADMTLE
jgi:hypothetical protein